MSPKTKLLPKVWRDLFTAQEKADNSDSGSNTVAYALGIGQERLRAICLGERPLPEELKMTLEILANDLGVPNPADFPTYWVGNLDVLVARYAKNPAKLAEIVPLHQILKVLESTSVPSKWKKTLAQALRHLHPDLDLADLKVLAADVKNFDSEDIRVAKALVDHWADATS